MFDPRAVAVVVAICCVLAKRDVLVVFFSIEMSHPVLIIWMRTAVYELSLLC